MFDVGPPTLVTGIVTKGRGDSRKQWVTRFRISYSNDTNIWYFYKDASHLDPKVFIENNFLFLHLLIHVKENNDCIKIVISMKLCWRHISLWIYIIAQSWSVSHDENSSRHVHPDRNGPRGMVRSSSFQKQLKLLHVSVSLHSVCNCRWCTSFSCLFTCFTWRHHSFLCDVIGR